MTTFIFLPPCCLRKNWGLGRETIYALPSLGVVDKGIGHHAFSGQKALSFRMNFNRLVSSKLVPRVHLPDILVSRTFVSPNL